MRVGANVAPRLRSTCAARRFICAVSTMPETVIVRIINPIATGGENRPGHQVGLNASQVRIEALTGGRGSVITQQEGKRFIATVRLPANG